MLKTALVTGAGSGIGRGFALALARRGYHLILVGRDEPRLQAVAGEIKLFSTASVFVADLSDSSARSQLIASVLAQNGVPTLLVNNAARMLAGDYLECSSSNMEALLSVNLLAPAELTRRFCALDTPPQGVIFILSTAARFPQPYNSLYSASKAGLRFLAESLQVELDGKTRICLAYPPLTATPMTDRFGSSSWPVYKADGLKVAERIIARYEAGHNQITWFDWEALPSLLYRLVPGLFRWVLKSQRHALRKMFNISKTDQARDD